MWRAVLAALTAAILLAGCGNSQRPPVIHVHSQHSFVHTFGFSTNTPMAGDVLYTTNGEWSGSPTGFTFLWEDCDSNGNNCVTAAGSPTNTQRYQIVTGDAGFTIRVAITASYAGHPSATVASQPTAVVVGNPVEVIEPVVSGTVATGDVLTTTNGTWTNTPTSYTYQWQDCATDGTSCSNIGGATSSTYTVASGDAGHSIEALVTATNVSGSSSPAGAPIVPLIDNFGGSSLDTNMWTALNQQGDTSNSEVECYEPGQISVASNALTISTVNVASFTCPSGTPASSNPLTYKSGAIQESATAFTYGTIKVSAQLPGGSNTSHPTIWLLGATCQTSSTSPFTFLSGTSGTLTGYYCPWDADSSSAAEIDIVETPGSNITTGALHNSALGGSDPFVCSGSTVTNGTTTQNTYELDWAAGSLTWKINGSTVCSTTTDVPSHPMFLIVNNAICNNSYCGPPSGGSLPQSMIVDYVHVSH